MKVWKKNLVAVAVLVTVCAGIYINWLYAGEESTQTLTATLDAEKVMSDDLSLGEDMTAIIGQQAYFGYANARREFKAKYGYTPVKVPVYGIYGFDITNFESEDNNNVSI